VLGLVAVCRLMTRLLVVRVMCAVDGVRCLVVAGVFCLLPISGERLIACSVAYGDAGCEGASVAVAVPVEASVASAALSFADFAVWQAIIALVPGSWLWPTGCLVFRREADGGWAGLLAWSLGLCVPLVCVGLAILWIRLRPVQSLPRLSVVVGR